MNIGLVESAYEKLLKMNDGTSLYKMDLHIHTPASKCYKMCCKSREDEYIKILDKAIEENIKIIAITDHNTFEGYFEIKKILNANIALNKKYKDFLILPGIEISNFGTHYLAIFNNEKDYEKQKERLGVFLTEIGIDMEDRGNELSDAINVTPTQLLKKINEYEGISILAHADASNGLLEKLLHPTKKEKGKEGDEDGWMKNGKSLAKIVTSEYLTAISLKNPECRRKLEYEILRSKSYKREKMIAIIYCSDAHSCTPKLKASGGQIGDNFSYIKLSKLSFGGLKLGLLDPEVRIYDDNYDTSQDYSYIEGVAIKGGFIRGSNDSSIEDFALVKLHKQLNCIIGARGTGKSTILNIIKGTLLEDKSSGNYVYDEAIVYLRQNKICYAICAKPRIVYDDYTGEKVIDTDDKKIYYKDGKEKFKSQKSLSKNMMGSIVNTFTSYNQKDIYKYSESTEGVMTIINNLAKIHGEDLISEEKHLKSNFNNTFDQLIKKSEDRSILYDFLMSDSDYNGEYMDELIIPYKKFIDYVVAINNKYEKIVNEINKSIQSHVKFKINYTIFSQENISRIIALKEQRTYNQYEETVFLRKTLLHIMNFANTRNEWDLWIYVFKNDSKSLMDKYNLSQSEAIKFIKITRVFLNDKSIYYTPRVVIDFSYNVNSGISNKSIFREREQLSLGQRSVAMLLTIIKAANDMGDNRPLIIDQPEDDLDNVYIYSSLVNHFREVKNNRQLIIATHNANIPIAGDAENILIMNSDGESGYINKNGSIDKQDICKSVLDILEGGNNALKLRLSKYNKFIK